MQFLLQHKRMVGVGSIPSAMNRGWSGTWICWGNLEVHAQSSILFHVIQPWQGPQLDKGGHGQVVPWLLMVPVMWWLHSWLEPPLHASSGHETSSQLLRTVGSCGVSWQWGRFLVVNIALGGLLCHANKPFLQIPCTLFVCFFLGAFNGFC